MRVYTMNLITKKQSKRYPGLYTLRYKRKVFYDNLWDRELIEARGRVVDEYDNTVINPFTKIFNRNENNTDINRSERCLVVNKVNGFMCAATWVDKYGEVIISTTGSLDSEHVAMAGSFFTDKIKDMIATYTGGYTLLFEVVHPKAPHIIKEEPGLYLIGARKVSETSNYFSTETLETSLDLVAEEMGVKRPKWKLDYFSDIVKEVKVAKHEGYVVYGLLTGVVLKIKTPYYMILKSAARVKDITKLNYRYLDEEFYPLVDNIKANAVNFQHLNEQERLQYLREFYEI